MDNDPVGEVSAGAFFFIEDGTHANQGFVVSKLVDNFSLGTSDLDFVQFSGAASFTAGESITISNNQVSVTDSGIDTDKLANGSVTAAKLDLSAMQSNLGLGAGGLAFTSNSTSTGGTNGEIHLVRRTVDSVTYLTAAVGSGKFVNLAPIF